MKDYAPISLRLHAAADLAALMFLLVSLRISADRGRCFSRIVDGISEERGRRFRLIVDAVSA